MRSTALESLAHESEMLEDVNSLYSDAVNRAKAGGIQASHDYANRKGVIPIPPPIKRCLRALFWRGNWLFGIAAVSTLPCLSLVWMKAEPPRESSVCQRCR